MENVMLPCVVPSSDVYHLIGSIKPICGFRFNAANYAWWHIIIQEERCYMKNPNVNPNYFSLSMSVGAAGYRFQHIC